MAFKFRRGLEAERIQLSGGTEGDIPPIGEPLWVTDTKKLYVGDGATHGGVLASISEYTDVVFDHITATTVTTTGTSMYTTGLYSSGVVSATTNLLGDNVEIKNRVYLNADQDYAEAQIVFDQYTNDFLIWNTGDTEFRFSDKLFVPGDVVSIWEDVTYTLTATTTGTEVLGGDLGVGNHHEWAFAPADLTLGYTWNYIDGAAIQWRSGIVDHTTWYDDRDGYYHMIGIHTVYSGTFATAASSHSAKNGVDFLHARTKNFSAGSFEEVGLITSLGSDTKQEPALIDGYFVSNIWAPHMLEWDNAYYMFYTGVDTDIPGNKQRVFCAKSHDPIDWSAPIDIKMVLHGEDPNWTPTDLLSCRDPFVIRDEVENRWVMFVTTAVDPADLRMGDDGSGQNVEVVGIATSSTLMEGWELVDWVEDSERPFYPYSGNGESPQCFKGTDDLWYLAWSAKELGIYTHMTAFASATTLTIEGTSGGTGWTLIPDFNGISSPATEFTQSPYDDNIWIATTIQPYQNGDMRNDWALTFTGAGPYLALTGHSATTLNYSASTAIENRLNLSQAFLSHIRENQLHEGSVPFTGSNRAVELGSDLDVAGVIYSGGVDISTMMGDVGGSGIQEGDENVVLGSGFQITGTSGVGLSIPNNDASVNSLSVINAATAGSNFQAGGAVYTNYQGANSSYSIYYFHDLTASAEYLRYNKSSNWFEFSGPIKTLGQNISGQSIYASGVIYSGGVDISTMMGSGGGGAATAATASVVYGNNNAQRTFSGDGHDFFFPRNVYMESVVCGGDAIYINSAGTENSASITFHLGATPKYFYHIRAGAGANKFVLSDSLRVEGGLSANTEIYAAGGRYHTSTGSSNVDGTGLWFGSNTSSYSVQYNSTTEKVAIDAESGITLDTFSNINWLGTSTELQLVPGHSLSATSSFYSAKQIIAKWDLQAGNNIFVNADNYSGDGGTLLNGQIYFHDGGLGAFDHLANWLSYYTGISSFHFSDKLEVDGSVSGSSLIAEGFIADGGLTPLTIGGNQQRTALKIEATDTAGAGLTTTELVMEGYENRGNGIFLYDGDVTNGHWFAGTPYQGTVENYIINYTADTSTSARDACRNIDGSTHPIFSIDGSNKRVGINTNLPTSEFSVSGDVEVSGIIYSGGVDISTMMGGGASLPIKASDVDGNTVQADSTFAGGVNDHYWFPAYLLIKGEELYIDSAGASNTNSIQFHGGDAYMIYNHTDKVYAWLGSGNGTVDFQLWGDFYAGNGKYFTSNPGYNDDDNVDGTGLWFGSGTSSYSIQYDAGTTKVVIDAASGITLDTFSDIDWIGTNSSISLQPGHWVTVTPTTVGAGLWVRSGQTKLDQDLLVGVNAYINTTNYTAANSGTIFFGGPTGTGEATFQYKTGDTSFHLSENVEVSGKLLATDSITGASLSLSGGATVGTTLATSNFNHTGKYTSYGQIDFFGSGLGSNSGLTKQKSITLIDPQATDNVTMWRTDRSISATSTVVVAVGSSPTCTWALRMNTDRSSSPGTTINNGSGGISTTTGTVDTSMVNTDIAADTWVWLDLGATGGTISEFHVTLNYIEV